MKAGTRALGIADSSGESIGTFAGCVVRADRVFDGVAFSSFTVGGTDATNAVLDIVASLDREDVQYLLLAGIAPGWFNIVDLHRLHRETSVPVLSISFEGSTGLSPEIKNAFEGKNMQARLEVYESLPERRRLCVGSDELFVRSVGISRERADDIVRAFTPAGGRPEPLRVARLAARSGREYRHR